MFSVNPEGQLDSKSFNSHSSFRIYTPHIHIDLKPHQSKWMNRTTKPSKNRFVIDSNWSKRDVMLFESIAISIIKMNSIHEKKKNIPLNHRKPVCLDIICKWYHNFKWDKFSHSEQTSFGWHSIVVIEFHSVIRTSVYIKIDIWIIIRNVFIWKMTSWMKEKEKKKALGRRQKCQTLNIHIITKILICKVSFSIHPPHEPDCTPNTAQKHTNERMLKNRIVTL